MPINKTAVKISKLHNAIVVRRLAIFQRGLKQMLNNYYSWHVTAAGFKVSQFFAVEHTGEHIRGGSIEFQLWYNRLFS